MSGNHGNASFVIGHLSFDRGRRAAAGLAVLALGLVSGCAAIEEMGVRADESLVDIQRVDPRIQVDIRYATHNNFMHRPLYPMARCLLRESVARRLSRVQEDLGKTGLGLKIHDGYRPLSIQREMWAVMPDERYVADPAKGSRHNRGAAVDVTLVDSNGRELEMPSGYDEFSERAHLDYQGASSTALQNRERLVRAMRRRGFKPLATEWWHYDAPGWRKFPLLDVPLTHSE